MKGQRFRAKHPARQYSGGSAIQRLYILRIRVRIEPGLAQRSIHEEAFRSCRIPQRCGSYRGKGEDVAIGMMHFKILHSDRQG